MQSINWSRSVPLRYEADVAVIGGGIAGVAAACSAAAGGPSVILVERFAVTGGNATVGGVAAFCGETRFQGQVFDEIIADMEKWNAIESHEAAKKREARVFDHHILAVVLQELLLRYGVKLLLHTRFVDARLKNGHVSECLICGKSGLEALRARVFIDCTGEAELAHAAGLQTVKGREADHLQLPMSIMGLVRDLATDPQVPQGLFEPLRDPEDLPMVSVWPNGPGGKALKIKVPMFDATDTEAITAAEIAGRRRLMQVLDYYQRVERKDWRYDGCAPQIGIREGRRILGDYVLTLDDLRAGRRFDDAIARSAYQIDAHKPDDDKRTFILPREEWAVPPYQIPFRALLPKGGKNILAAGRCFSADQLALASARVMTTCAMLGQAAGIAASLSVENKCDPRDLDYGLIRRTVEARGARLEV